MVLRAADPHCWGHECVQLLGHESSQVVTNQRVRRQRHVGSVLLRGAEPDHDRVAAGRQFGLHLRPGHLIQLDSAHRNLLALTAREPTCPHRPAVAAFSA